ncbi:MAG TPA: glycoside hydrolase family 30 beta sandwich domain-containing protein [Candidatus Limnocylindrales bacterium]|nr:glycoside hydrolase family 30 beta sandwich domain-containing protein [Candidatus Limnocylindrales bacterium]
MTTRREVLRYAGLGMGAAAASALGLTVTTEAETQAGQASLKPAQTEITDKSGKRLAAGAECVWTKAAKKAGPADITVDPTKPMQTILGFGAAFTEAACFTLSRLSESDRATLLKTMFGQDQHALSIGRISIGASDYSIAAYSYDDGAADPELKRFSIDHDRDYVLPTLRAALGVNPDLFFFGSPWSPPAWMKYSNSMLGGNIRPEHIPTYARYLQKFVEAYAAAGVNLRAMTPQNEIDADQGGRMPACPWPQEDEERLVVALGPLLEASGTKIWMLDHNYSLWGRVLDQLSNPRFKKWVNTVAWHGYLGAPEMMRNVKEKFPDVEMHWTEGGDDYKFADYWTSWCKWGATFSGILANGPQSITTWNLALDERGRPNIGPFDCGGLVQIHSVTKEIKQAGLYWALAQYARAIRRGAVIVASQDANGDQPSVSGVLVVPPGGLVSGTGIRYSAATSRVFHTAAKNPDGSMVLVLTNPGDARELTVACSGQITKVTLTADSITTLRWS